MALQTSIWFIMLGTMFLNILNAVNGGGMWRCEELPVEMCAFAVSPSAARCVLERRTHVIQEDEEEGGITSSNTDQYECKTSMITADNFRDSIEMDECVNACGLERMSVGMSTDALIDSQSIQLLCSSKCHHNCLNIVDLYSNLATAEGVSLRDVCEAERSMKSRKLISIKALQEYPAPTPFAAAFEVSAEAPAAAAVAEYGPAEWEDAEAPAPLEINEIEPAELAPAPAPSEHGP